GFAFRFSSFAFRFSMLRIFRGFGGADRHVRRQFLESLLRNPRHGQQILGALERSALRAKIDDRLRRHWPDPRQLLELLQRRRIQINRMRRQRLLRRHRRAGKHQSAYKDVNQYLQARRSTIPRHTAPTPESFCHFHPLQRHRLGRSFATGRLRLVPSNWDHLTKNRNDSQKRSPTAIAASLSQFDRLDLFDTKVKATAMHRQIRDRRTFFFGPPKNPVFSYSSRGSALRASNWSSSRNCGAPLRERRWPAARELSRGTFPDNLPARSSDTHSKAARASRLASRCREKKRRSNNLSRRRVPLR